MKRFVELLRTHSLFRNASFLMLSTVIMSVLGFGFWLFVAHLYSPEQVGVASALISMTTLLSSLSLFGFEAGLLRFLPKAKSQSRMFNAAAVIVGGLALVSGLAYTLIDTLFMGNVGGEFTRAGAPLFAIIVAVMSLNILTDAIFIANRRAEYHTIVYAVFGLVKLVLPAALIGLGWMGVYGAYAIAGVVTLALSIWYMVRVAGYSVKARPDWAFIPAARKYSFHNYVGAQLSGIPAQIMPLIILHQIGAAQAAFFSMAWTMVNLLYVAPTSVAQSLLAEGAHSPEQRAKHLRHAIKLLTVILVPGVAAAILVAPYLLRVFGQEYAAGSTQVFQILALATFFTAVAAVGDTVLNLQHRTVGIMAAQAATLVATFAATAFLIPYGLVGVGWAMFIGFAASTVVYAIIFIRKQ